MSSDEPSRKKIRVEKPNIVKKHVDFFAEDNGELTDFSMKVGHVSQRIEKGVSLKIRAIKNMLSKRNLPQTSEALCTIENPARTGIWNIDGTFNEDVFNEISSKAINVVGKHTGRKKRVVTKQIILDFLKDKYKKAVDKIGNACNIFFVIPVNWKRVTKGSIDELFEYYSDCNYKGEKTLTVERLREFYTNPSELMNKKLDKNKIFIDRIILK